ncbi:MAG TPA: carboxyl transferase domain-containing protein, partial [Clostridia bacterium]|nr:carboxyl transferase domain-containing protein [Clostridia bacterium]
VADALQEKEGLIRHAAKMVYAFTEADVPKINIITGKAIGGAYIAMNSKATGCDIVFAYPTASVAVMDSEGAANIIYNEQIAKSDNPVEFRKAKIKEYHERFASPYEAAKRGYVDDVINPAFTRAYVITALEMLKSKRENRPNRKHGNMPL